MLRVHRTGVKSPKIYESLIKLCNYNKMSQQMELFCLSKWYIKVLTYMRLGRKMDHGGSPCCDKHCCKHETRYCRNPGGWIDGVSLLTSSFWRKKKLYWTYWLYMLSSHFDHLFQPLIDASHDFLKETLKELRLLSFNCIQKYYCSVNSIVFKEM